MLKNDCQTKWLVDQIATCTRESLNEQYGTAWRSAPAAIEFLSFIDMVALRAKQGKISEQDAQREITTYATTQANLVDAQRAQQQADNLRLGLALLAGSNGTAPRAPGKLMAFGGPGHDTYLGCLNCNEYATDSVFNQYGQFGNTYSLNSVHNEIAQFGSSYSAYSACNPYASDPPVIVDSAGNFYGRLTVNAFNPQRTRSNATNEWLATVCAH